MVEKIIGEVRLIKTFQSISGEKTFDSIGSMYYKFDKQTIKIHTKKDGFKEIDFVGKKIDLLKKIEIGLIYEFEVETKYAYGNTYYNCKYFKIIEN